MLAFGQADGILEFAANREHGRLFVLEKHRNGDKSSRAAHLSSDAIANSDDGVVAAQEDVTIVDQKEIGKIVKTPHGFMIVDRDRLFAEIAAGHDQRFKSTRAKQQIVKWRIG